MSNDLVKRLRTAFVDFDDLDDAANRIEELEAKLAKAVEALRGWIEVANAEGMPVPLSDLEAAELKGETND